MDGEKTCLGKVYFDMLNKYRERILLYITETGEEITYQDVLTQGIRTAIKLKKKGITRNDILFTCSHNHKYSIIPLLASNFLGVLCGNIDPYHVSQEYTDYYFSIAKPKFVFASKNVLDSVEKCVQNLNLNTEIVVFGKHSKYTSFEEYLKPEEDENSFNPVIINEDDEALIVLTSGSTGTPKLVTLSFRSFKMDLTHANTYNSNPKNDLFYSNFYLISAHLMFSRCLVNGNSLVFCKKFDPNLTWKYFEKYKVSFAFFCPYNATELLIAKPQKIDISSVKLIATGSGIVTEKLMMDLRAAFPSAMIFNAYSQTEFGGTIICYFNPDTEYEEQLKKPLSSGKIAPGLDWKVVDLETGKSLGPNELGELRIRSPSLMVGYYKSDRSSVFDPDGYLKTNDLVYYDNDKCIYVVSRVSSIFKYKGHSIYHGVLERVLLSHFAVKDAAVVGVPCGEDGKVPLGAVVLRNGFETINPNDILNYFNDRVKDYEQLRGGLRIIDSIPKTALSKTRRTELLKVLRLSV